MIPGLIKHSLSDPRLSVERAVTGALCRSHANGALERFAELSWLIDSVISGN